MSKDTLTAEIMLDAMRECDEAEATIDKLRQELANVRADLADAKGELRGERRTVSMLEDALKKAAAEHAESEKRSAQMVADVSAAFAVEQTKEQPDWLLDVVGRDGNNDLQQLRLRKDA